jgi:hypothetical protein
MMKLDYKPQNNGFRKNIYSPKRLHPSEYKLARCLTTRLDKKDYIMYDKLGLMGKRTYDLDEIRKTKYTTSEMIKMTMKNINIILDLLRTKRDYADTGFLIDLFDSKVPKNKQIGLYLLLNGEVNNDVFGIVNNHSAMLERRRSFS